MDPDPDEVFDYPGATITSSGSYLHKGNHIIFNTVSHSFTEITIDHKNYILAHSHSLNKHEIKYYDEKLNFVKDCRHKH